MANEVLWTQEFMRSKAKKNIFVRYCTSVKQIWVRVFIPQILIWETAVPTNYSPYIQPNGFIEEKKLYSWYDTVIVIGINEIVKYSRKV